MSYEILYRSRFIKTSKGIIPVVEMGSNNCYEVSYGGGRERRSRDWQELRLKSFPLFLTEAQIVFMVDDWYQMTLEHGLKLGLTEEGVKRTQSWYCGLRVNSKSSSTYYDVLNFFKRGIKNAKTVEEWSEVGVNIQIRPQFGTGYSVSKPYAETEQDLFDIEDLLVNQKKVYISSSGEERKTIKHRTGFYPTSGEVFYTVKCPSGGFIRNLKYGYKYTCFGVGTKYKTRKQAESVVRGREGFEVVEHGV